MSNKRIALYIILLFSVFQTRAQLLNEMFTEDSSIDTIPLHSLRLDIDAVGFFRDNEYKSDLQNGYTLPGARLSPHLAFNPLRPINIELGASMLFYNGANRYPNFAYHDIATWKGNQYQHGCHVLPWIRLQASFKHVDVVLGNIYGAANHGIILPLFNPEQNLSTDPEMGAQVMLHRRHIQLDTWINWQSYIFETDSHQEAFTVGTTARVLWGNPDKALTFYSPLQVLIQHRGGEQDLTKMGTQTISNGSVGAGVTWKPVPSSPLNTLDAQLNAIGSYQQNGQLWPFDTGFAWHAGINTKWLDHLTLSANYVHTPKQFISVYGNPFYSSISLKNGGTQINPDGTISGHYENRYKALHTLHLGLDYHYTFAKAYTLGADVELYSMHSQKRAEGATTFNPHHETNFSFGLYLHVAPSILLKQWK